MGGFSIWHFVILSVVLAVPVVVFAAVWLAMRRNQRAQAARHVTTSPPPPSVEERLRALEALRAQGLVDQAEYERRRQQILADL